MALRVIGVIPAIKNNYDEEIYKRRVAEAELPRLSPALWRELRYLGRIEQDIHRQIKEMEVIIENGERVKDGV
jgi:hypothetical protein